MKLYAEQTRFRTRQLLNDAAVLLWIVLWTRIGLWVNELVERLAAPGRTVEDAGRGFAETLGDAARRVTQIPVVGEGLRTPLDAAAEAGRTLRDAGAAQQDAVHDLALWLGILLAVIPISYVLYRYLPARVRWIREASAAQRLRIDAADLRLFAYRAIATRPLYELQQATPDPAAALDSGDYEPLAALELGSLGLGLKARF